MAESLSGPLQQAIAGLKPEDQATLTKDYFTKKLPGWDKLKPEEQGSLVTDFVGKYGANVPGSVMGGPPTTGNRLAGATRTMGEVAVGTALPVAAAALGPEGQAAQVAVQGAVGAAQPYVEAGIDKLTGGDPAMPSLKDAARSAAFNAGLTFLGGIPKAGKAAAVAGQIRALPEEAQTVGNVKQAMRLRDFWLKSGATPEQADQIVTLPQTDLEALTHQNVQAGKDFKGAFQSVLTNQRAEFKNRYEAAMGKAADVPFDPTSTGQAFLAATQTGGQHELSPAFRSFLARKGNELAVEKGSAVTSDSVMLPDGSVYVPGKAQTTAPSLGNTNSKTSQDTGPFTPQKARELRTELRENLPASATPLDKKVFNDLNTQLTKTIEGKLEEGGAKPENIAAMRAIDDEYGRFQDTIQKLDPRSGKFGNQISDLLFDKQLKNPEQAVNFVRMAQAAEQAHPGEVMPQLRASFMDKVLSDTKQEAQGRPVEEMRLIQKMQSQWGGDKNAHAVLGSIFGADSPMANTTTGAKVLGALANSDAAAQKLASSAGLRNAITPPHWLIKIGGAYALYSAMTGSPTGPWSDMHKDPARFLAGMGALMLSTTMAGKILGSADKAVQAKYVDFLLDPSAKTLSNATSAMGSFAGSISGLPSDKSSTPPP